MGTVQQFCTNALLLDSGRILMQGRGSDVAGYYLSKSLPQQGAAKAQKEFVADPDKAVQIRRVAVLDCKGNPVDFIDFNEEFIVQIDYEFRESLEYISIGCQIIADENQQTLISLSDPEMDAKRLDKRKVGYYQSQIVIPAKILNTGSYWVRVGATQLGASSDGGAILDVVDNISFWVSDKVGIMKHMGFERKNSLLSIQLPWEAKRLETQHDAS